MKKLFFILTVCVLLLCVSCAGTIIDGPAKPPEAAKPDIGAPESSPLTEELPTTEPDIFAPGFNPPVGIEMSSDTYEAGEKIAYTFVNRTDSPVNILNIPTLYIYTQVGQEHVKQADGVGFCGTPDCVAAISRSLEWTLDTELLYGGELEPGKYMLRFKVVNDDYEMIEYITCDFQII